jgi:hydroxyacylglutathione hydrolase
MDIFRLVFNPIEVNTYILADESGKCAVIDCGCYDDAEFNRLKKFMEKKNLTPVLLLDTHCHLDHIFGNAMFLKEFGIKPLSHQLEEENRIDAPDHAKLFGLRMDIPPEPARFLNDSETISFGNESLDIIHVPGHSAGSLAFFSQAGGVIFTGDALFSGSIGRTDLPGGNFETLIRSISSRIFTLPAATIVYPGHGEGSSVDAEMKTNPYFLDSNR